MVIYFNDSIVSPLFHSFKGMDDYNDELSNHAFWDCYKSFNKIMTESIIKHRKGSKDIVWINESNLLLMPKYLRKIDNTVSVSLFLHSAFPNSQLMMIFPWRMQLLNSMLHAELIGFHIFEYAKNFMTCCIRFMNVTSEFSRGGFL